MEIIYPKTQQALTSTPTASRIPGLFASCALAVGFILGVSGLTMWPICFAEGWNGDPLITIMLVSALLLLAIGCHQLDRLEERARIGR